MSAMTATRSARWLALVALAFGLSGDYLLRAPTWGINVALGLALMAIAALVASMLSVSDRGERQQTARWPWLAAAFFAAMWAVRDAELLLAVDLLAAVSLACLPLIPGGKAGLREAGVLDVVTAAIGTAWRAATGAADLMRHLRPQAMSGPALWRRVATMGIGLLLAIPSVLIFGALFASADPVFDKMVDSLIGVTLKSLASHVILTMGLAWTAAGYLWTHAAARRVTPPALSPVTLGYTPMVTVLGATALVFALFILVQAQSLFGGEAFVQAQTGLTYAEYARRGFFQMVFAAALALPLVYVAWFAAGSPADARSAAGLRLIMALQLGLTTLVLVSALWRLGLYVRAYGLTEDRLYGVAVLLWIATVIALFVPTVLRGRPTGVVHGMIVAAVVILAALNLADPAALVARYNLAHQERRTVDVNYLTRLSADAVPVIVARLQDVPSADRCALVHALMRRHGASPPDWRGWNLARARARRALAELELPACAPHRAQ
ncbi:hypothetical protein HRbin10_01538 [bacterium HR10]|nr:hypothetical protein HRbin10_01538 [bacterium HR10]